MMQCFARLLSRVSCVAVLCGTHYTVCVSLAIFLAHVKVRSRKHGAASAEAPAHTLALHRSLTPSKLTLRISRLSRPLSSPTPPCPSSRQLYTDAGARLAVSLAVWVQATTRVLPCQLPQQVPCMVHGERERVRALLSGPGLERGQLSQPAVGCSTAL